MISEDSKQLPEIVMSGVYSIISFTVNGRDAEYLSENEFSSEYGGPSQDSLISLPPHTCYARFLREDNVLSRPFFFNSVPPFEIDENLQKKVMENRKTYSKPKAEALADASKYLGRMEKYISLNTDQPKNDDKSKVKSDSENKYPDNNTPVEAADVAQEKEEQKQKDNKTSEDADVTMGFDTDIEIDDTM